MQAKRVLVPAQEWECAAGACCAQRMAEATAGDIVTVPAYEFAGYLYAVLSYSTGGHAGEWRVEAWQLLPRRLYSGPTTGAISWMGHDDSSSRVRGDSTGLRLKIRGSEMVCAKPVHFIRTLPTVPAISASAAIAYDAGMRSSGWRAHFYQGAKVAWKTLAGHPVVVYECPQRGRPMAMLLWRYEKAILEYLLPGGQDLASLPDLDPARHGEERGEEKEPVQELLF